MACFTPAFIESLLIWLVWIIFLFAVAGLLIPFLMTKIGAPPGGGIVITILTWFIWALIAVAVIIFVFNMLGCLFPGGTGFPRVR